MTLAGRSRVDFVNAVATRNSANHKTLVCVGIDGVCESTLDGRLEAHAYPNCKEAGAPRATA